MSLLNRMIVVALAATFFQVGTPASATRTEVIKDDDFKTLQQGELEGVALSSDGFLYPSHARKLIGDTGAEIVWAVVDQGGRGLLCATGHEGKLIRIDLKGEVHELGVATETELTALLEMPDGSVLVAGAPGGKIYRFTTEDEIEPYAEVEAKFIWKMALDNRGAVWAATGPEGKLFKISTQRGKVQVEESLDLPSTNLIDLWIDDEGSMGEKGSLYVAGERPGYLYRYSGEGSSTEVLYDAKSDEIRAIEPTAEGLMIATNTERSPTPQALNLTLRMSGAPLRGESTEGGAPGGGPNSPDADMGDIFASAQPQPQNPVSRVVLLKPDGYAEFLWNSPERPIHAIRSAPEGSLLVAAGGRGRIFKLSEDRRFSLIADTQEDFIMGLTPVKEGWIATGARNGVVYKISEKPEAHAVYRSRVLGSSAPVKWGKFYWGGENDKSTGLKVAFRFGNTQDADQGGWSEWSKDQNVASKDGVSMPEGPSRFFQYRLTMETSSSSASLLRTDYVEAFYQEENRAPRLRTINVSEMPVPGEAGGNVAAANGGAQNQGGTPKTDETQSGGRKAHSNTGGLQVNWNAVDPNQDDLEFELHFKADDEHEWKLVQDELRQSNVPLLLNGVADGRYRFRVTASDRLANPPGAELTDEIISEEFVVDNSPPQLLNLRVVVEGRRGRLQVRVVDPISLVSSVEIDIDNEDTYVLFPEDGLFDERTESIDWQSMELEPGEHVMTVAATDRQGNTQVEKTLFNIPE